MPSIQNVKALITFFRFKVYILDCGAPPNVTHGKVGLYNSTTYGQEVIYACFDGHVLSGSNKVVCQENSTWSPPPTCTLVGRY